MKLIKIFILLLIIIVFAIAPALCIIIDVVNHGNDPSNLLLLGFFFMWTQVCILTAVMLEKFDKWFDKQLVKNQNNL